MRNQRSTSRILRLSALLASIAFAAGCATGGATVGGNGDGAVPPTGDGSAPPDSSSDSSSDALNPKDGATNDGSVDSGQDSSTHDGATQDTGGGDGALDDAAGETGGGGDADLDGSHDAEGDSGFDAGVDSGVDAGVDAGHDSGVDASDGSSCIVVATPDDDAGEVPDARACASYDGAVCTPKNSESVYSPPAWVAPTAASVCSTTQIQDFWNNCYNNTDGGGDCNSYTSGSNSTCGACLFTSRAGTAYGPVIYQAVSDIDFYSPNIAGCVATYEPCNQGCAELIQAQDDCESAACNTTSCASDAITEDQYLACIAEADNCSCYGYATAATDCMNELNAGAGHPAASNNCFAMTNDEGTFTAIAIKFCGDGGL